jgi:1-acyl-sn-glycerol-3-phosphate acyltransferase
MRQIIRLFSFLIINILFLVLAIIVAIIFLPFGSKTHRKVTTFFVPIYGRIFLFIFGIKVKLTNSHYMERKQNYFIIGNHLSYIDVILLGSQIPVLFVAKKEVRKWPILGTLAWLGGMLFIDRTITGRTHRPYIHQIAGALKDGFNISLFPEGTSSNGETVLPFKKTIFSCPVLAQKPILPIAIRYLSVNHQPFSPANRDLVCWYADMKFVDHFWRFLGLKEFSVEIVVMPPRTEAPEEDWINQNRRLASKYHDIVKNGYFRVNDEE